MLFRSDGVNDNGLSFVTYYGDADGDTYGDLNNSESYCADPGSPFVTNDADCDDTNASVNPGSTEIWENGIDDDCNPSTSDVSVEDYSIAEFTIFPNPVENLLTVSASNGILENVFIYNSIGMLLKIITPIDSLEVIDMSSWPSGQYIIRVGHLNKTIVKF